MTTSARREGVLPGARRCLPVLLLALLALAAACRKEETVFEGASSFNALALEVADALSLQDTERLVENSNKVRLVCDEQKVATVDACRGKAPGAAVEGFDVKFQGRGAQVTLLDGGQIRLLLEGMFNPDLQAPPDAIGGAALQLYSTLMPDKTIFFPADEQNLPQRGTMAITYIGVSPGEQDMTSKRRLFAAVAEPDSKGVWRIRLWLVGFYRPDHPALNPSPDNGYKRWQPPK